MCLIGANRGCKTRLVRPHVLDPFDDRYLSTMGTKVSKKEVRTEPAPAHAPLTLDLIIWDLLSAPGFQDLLKEAYYHGSRGILAVVDMTRRSTLDHLGAWIADVENVSGPVPIVVVGANRDRADRQEVSEDEMRHVAADFGAPCFFALTNSDECMEPAFQQLADRIAARWLRGSPV